MTHFVKSPLSGYWVINTPNFTELGVKEKKAAKKWARKNGFEIYSEGKDWFWARRV